MGSWGRSRGFQGPLEAVGEWEGQGCFVLGGGRRAVGESGTKQKFTGPHEVTWERKLTAVRCRARFKNKKLSVWTSEPFGAVALGTGLFMNERGKNTRVTVIFHFGDFGHFYSSFTKAVCKLMALFVMENPLHFTVHQVVCLCIVYMCQGIIIWYHYSSTTT